MKIERKANQNFIYQYFQKDLKCLIPPNVEHINKNLKSISPSQNKIIVESGESFEYDALVLATGVELDFDKIDGM